MSKAKKVNTRSKDYREGLWRGKQLGAHDTAQALGAAERSKVGDEIVIIAENEWKIPLGTVLEVVRRPDLCSYAHAIYVSGEHANLGLQLDTSVIPLFASSYVWVKKTNGFLP
jgi:hypothetical protein